MSLSIAAYKLALAARLDQGGQYKLAEQVFRTIKAANNDEEDEPYFEPKDKHVHHDHDRKPWKNKKVKWDRQRARNEKWKERGRVAQANLDLLDQMFSEHDWYHTVSDDAEVVQNGQEEKAEIQNFINHIGPESAPIVLAWTNKMQRWMKEAAPIYVQLVKLAQHHMRKEEWLSECCDRGPVSEVDEIDGAALGHCSGCKEPAVFYLYRS